MHSKLFFEAQSYPIDENMIYNDNQSTMKLKLNGNVISGKQTRHFNMKYFFITDLLNHGEIHTQYCQTNYMVADYMAKPLLGIKFHTFQQAIMNIQKK